MEGRHLVGVIKLKELQRRQPDHFPDILSRNSLDR